jgi:serine/threonine protein kinase
MPDTPQDAKAIAGLDVLEAAESAASLERSSVDPAAWRRAETRRSECGESDGPPGNPAAAAPTQIGPIAEHAGTNIGRYRLLELMGEGAMGCVWMSQQMEPVKRLVAIKLIKGGIDSKSVLARFEAERQALALMDHPNIAKVFDGGVTGHGSPYFAMELVKGVPITCYCDERKLTVRERLALFIPVCQAVQHAHLKGVIHRDLKPNNVLVARYDDRPSPKVIDFGIAKAVGQPLTDNTLVTGFGAIIGTPAYMSPEQATLDELDLDTRSDIYALGVLLYELMTGSTPFGDESKSAGLFELLRIIREKEPPRPSTKVSIAESLPAVAANRGTEPRSLASLLHSDLDWIVMKALEKDRNRRYETANGLAADIERYLAGEAVRAHPPSATYRLRKLVLRNRGPLVAAFAVLIVLMGGVAASTWQAAERTREQAERRLEQENVVTRTRQAVESQLDRAEASLRDHRLSQVNAFLGQAELLLAELDAPDIRDRVAAVQKDLVMVQRLDDAFAWRWNLGKGQVRLFPGKAKELLPAAFRQYGVTVGEQPAEATVRMIRRSTIADALRLALEQWFFLEPAQPGLRAILEADDPDPLRAEIRAAACNGRVDSASALAQSADMSKINPGFAASLGVYLPAEQGLRVMKAAWRRQPDSFPLAITIAARLTELDVVQKGSTLEAVGWGRMAVAIRPDSAFAHHCLGVALGECGDEDGKHIELREAMRLAPRFSRAASLLAFDLSRDPAKQEEALALYTLMVAAQPKNAGGHAGLCRHYARKHCWAKAAAECLSIYDSLNDPAYNACDSCFDDAFSIATLDSYQLVIAGLIAEHRQSDAFEFGEQIIPKSKQPYWECSGCARSMFVNPDGKGLPKESQSEPIRRKALEWLSRGVSGWESWLVTNPPGPDLRRWTEQCLSDANLSGVRDEKSLAGLPEQERKSWQKLWAEIRSLRGRTDQAKSASGEINPRRG